jgi:hypothetical protein
MNKPVMPAELEPAYAEYMALPLEQRLKQLAADVNRVASNDFKDATEAYKAMHLNMWQLKWIGYAKEITEDQSMIELVDLYRFLGRWRLRWQKLEEDPVLMSQIRNEAQEWFEKMLKWSVKNG